MCALLKRESFDAPEVQIFEAVQGWANKNCVDAGDLHAVIFQVRLPRVNVDQLLSIMLSGLMDRELIYKTIRMKNNSSALRM